jgi:hypothetical protein
MWSALMGKQRRKGIYDHRGTILEDLYYKAIVYEGMTVLFWRVVFSTRDSRLLYIGWLKLP